MPIPLALYQPTLSSNLRWVSLTLPNMPAELDPLLKFCRDNKRFRLREKLLTHSPLPLSEFQELYQELSAVSLPDKLILDDLHPAIFDAYQNHLAIPFQLANIAWVCEDNFLFYDCNGSQKQVPRPNHGLAMTLRGVAYVAKIIEYLKKHLNPAFIAAFENYTPRRIMLLQLAAIFRVVGRKDETGLKTNIPRAKEIYYSYREHSAEVFAEYCTRHKTELNLTDAELGHYYQVVFNMGNPAIYEAEYKSFQESSQNKSSTYPALLDNLLLHVAHIIDAYRYHPDAYEMVKPFDFRAICVESDLQAEDFEALLQFPLHLMEAMGDRIIKGNGSMPLHDKDYDLKKFIKANTDPMLAIEMINVFATKPTLIDVQAGPRNRSCATEDFQQLTNLLLDSENEVIISPNALNEIEISCRSATGVKTYYNFTHLLWGKPDFEQLYFSAKQLQAYEMHVNGPRNYLKPNLDGPESGTHSVPSAQAFLQHDPKHKYAHLSYAEKLAINQYTVSANNVRLLYVLRNGVVPRNWNLDENEFAAMVRDIILISAIASFALSKVPPSQYAVSTLAMQVLNRIEETADNSQVMTLRRENIKKKLPTQQLGFFSTSCRANIAEHHFSFVVLQPSAINPQGKAIAELAQQIYRKEAEVLYPPGTQFVFNTAANNTILYAYPVRSADIEIEKPYSRMLMATRRQLFALYNELIKQTQQINTGRDALLVLCHQFKITIAKYCGDLNLEYQQKCFAALIYHAKSLADYFVAAGIKHYHSGETQLRNLAKSIGVHPSQEVHPDWLDGFYYAAIEDDGAAVKGLVNLGLNINRLDDEGETVLFYAVRNRKLTSVLKLLLAGADINLKNNQGQRVVDKVLNDVDMMKILLRAPDLNIADLNLFDPWFSGSLCYVTLLMQFRCEDFLLVLADLANKKPADSRVKKLLATCILAGVIENDEFANAVAGIWNQYTTDSFYGYWLTQYGTVSTCKDPILLQMINSPLVLQSAQSQTFLDYICGDEEVTNATMLIFFEKIGLANIIQKLFIAGYAQLTPFEQFLRHKMPLARGDEVFTLIYTVAYQFIRPTFLNFIEHCRHASTLKALLFPAATASLEEVLLAINSSGFKLDMADIACFSSNKLSALKKDTLHLVFELYTESAQAQILARMHELPVLDRMDMEVRLRFAHHPNRSTLLQRLFQYDEIEGVPLLHLLLNQDPALLSAYLSAYPHKINVCNAENYSALNLAICHSLLRRIAILLCHNPDLFLKGAPVPFEHAAHDSDVMCMLYESACFRAESKQRFFDYLKTASSVVIKSVRVIALKMQHNDVLTALDERRVPSLRR